MKSNVGARLDGMRMHLLSPIFPNSPLTFGRVRVVGPLNSKEMFGLMGIIIIIKGKERKAGNYKKKRKIKKGENYKHE